MPIKKLLIAAGIVTLAVAAVYANLNRSPDAPRVRVQEVDLRDLTATVSGSGTIRPYKEVDISANVMGRITELAVAEGQSVERGEFLLRIDPVPFESAVDRVEASLESARTQLQLAREQLEFAQNNLDRKEGMYRQDLLSEDAYERAVQEVRQAQRTVEVRQQEVAQLQAQLQQVRHDLSKVTIDSPIDGIITRLNIEEGENVVTGTMNNPGTVILTIADLSTVEAEIEVDETDIVQVDLGQRARVRIDAFPNREFDAIVTEVGKSPISGGGLGQQSSDQAVVFKVVVRLQETVTRARPGLSCTADLITATRDAVVAVPIQALILRDTEMGEDVGTVRGSPPTDPAGADAGVPEAGLPSTDPASADDGDPPVRSAEERRTVEREGAFVVRDGRAVFTPIEVGIAGERHFEVLDGVEVGDRIVTGPFDVIRELRDGDPVQVDEEPE